MRAVILAGGKGVRLMPYTTRIPKPLVAIGNDIPVMEIIIRQLAANGFSRITVAVNHLANLIIAYFGDGSKLGVKIDYSMEEEPLSTIGPLTLIDDLPDNFLVMNGDILSDIDYKEFYDSHIQSGSAVTVATFKRTALIDYGVLKYDENNIITSFDEKPVYGFDVSMGIYCINKAVIDMLQKNTKYGFDDLMLDGVKNKSDYRVWPYTGFWIDIGRPEDYEYCNDNYPEIKNKLGL